MANIIITDDHQIFRESLAELLRKQDFNIIGMAANGKQFLKILENSVPDIVIMDISMPEMDGYEATKKSLELYPELKILILSSLGDESYYSQMLQVGVKGFVLKDAGINELKHAITEILNGGVWFSSELLQKVILKINSKPKEEIKIKFTNRELQVLNLICQGLKAEEIADKLCLSYETIRTYRANLLSKTECKNSISLVMYALKNKLIEI